MSVRVKRCAAFLPLLLVVCLAGWARAAAPTLDALRGAVDADELSLAALAQKLGDERVLSALGDDKDALLRLAAVRATPYLIDKDAALLPLARIAAGRDPELAPPAAFRARRIAQALVLEGAGAHEVMPATLAPAREALLALAADTTARRDLRLHAEHAAHLLGTLGVTSRAAP
jgi:hypothetical protein